MEGSCNISLSLTGAEYSFLTNMLDQCASKSVSGMSVDAILRTMVRLLQKLEVNVSGVRTEDQLLGRLQDAVR